MGVFRVPLTRNSPRTSSKILPSLLQELSKSFFRGLRVFVPVWSVLDVGMNDFLSRPPDSHLLVPEMNDIEALDPAWYFLMLVVSRAPVCLFVLRMNQFVAVASGK